MSEILWYFSFSDWFISLSIMFSRSIHTVAKGKTFGFNAIPIKISMTNFIELEQIFQIFIWNHKRLHIAIAML